MIRDISTFPTVNPEKLAGILDEHVQLDIQPGESSSVGPYLLIRSSDLVFERSQQNTLAVILPLKDYENMLKVCEAVESLHDALEVLGLGKTCECAG